MSRSREDNSRETLSKPHFETLWPKFVTRELMRQSITEALNFLLVNV